MWFIHPSPRGAPVVPAARAAPPSSNPPAPHASRSPRKDHTNCLLSIVKKSKPDSLATHSSSFPIQGDAKPFFLSEFRTVLHSILRNNPPWGSPASGTFFMKVLQCPQCRKGVWPLLETSLRYRTLERHLYKGHKLYVPITSVQKIILI